jgi:peptidoglycan/LPS O-acetylase OafA/YrhL
MKKGKLCPLCVAIIAMVICLLLFGLSFEAVGSIRGDWHAVDYWLLWFSIISFLGAAISGIFGVAWSMNVVDGLCDRNS